MERVDRGDAGDVEELPEGAWSVARLNDEIQSVLTEASGRFPTHVVGEVAEVDRYDFGAFFELRDLEAAPSISCLAWASVLADHDHDLEPGTSVVLEADVDFYPDRGDCQLLVAAYWPLGESDRKRELEALRRELAEEGLFDEARARPLPDYPACVGLVTSSSGSAREDVCAAIAERSPRTDVLLCGASVQGEDAVPSLLRAIERLDADPRVESIVLTRGGGSDVDLWTFNAEPLVRRVAACRTPIVAAIGHEDDDTLVEQAADRRAMTPTEAGVLATTPVEYALADLATLEHRIDGAYHALVTDRLEERERRVDAALDALEQRAERRAARRQRARDVEQRVHTAYRTLVESRLDDLERRVDAAYRDLETEARVEAGAAEARRLRIAVAVLLVLLVLGALAVLLFLL